MPAMKIANPPKNASDDASPPQKRRPQSASMNGQFWIVINITEHRKPKWSRPANFFRHASLERAAAEAERLRDAGQAGDVFGVFYCCGICRVAPAKSESTC